MTEKKNECAKEIAYNPFSMSYWQKVVTEIIQNITELMAYPFAGISYNQILLSLLLWKNGRRNTEDNPKTHKVVY